MFEIACLLKATPSRLVQGSERMACRGFSIDTRTIKPNEVFIAIAGNTFDGHDFIGQAIQKGAAAIIKEDGFKVSLPKGVACIEVKDTIRALGDIARFRRLDFGIPVIAITGSNGKTTTKDMIAGVLSKRYQVLKNEGTENNHIGVPLTLLRLDARHKIAVLELGTNHPGEIEYLTRISCPNMALITNIAPSHLEFFDNLEGVFKEKYALIQNLRQPAIAILNADDLYLRQVIVRKTKRPFVIGFGIRQQSDFFATRIACSSGRLSFRVNHKKQYQLCTSGYHNAYNALAAITVAKIFGLEYNDIAPALEEFSFLPGRFKVITSAHARFIDDTYNANPNSLQWALEALKNIPARGRKILILGDMLELGRHAGFWHRQAGKEIARVCDMLISVGKLAKLAVRAACSWGLDEKNIFTCSKTSQARDILLRAIRVRRDDLVLVKGSRAMKMENVF